MEERTVKVPAIGCNGCVNTIKSELGDLDGVVKVDGSVEGKTITVQWSDPASWAKIVDVMTEIEYPPEQA